MGARKTPKKTNPVGMARKTLKKINQVGTARKTLKKKNQVGTARKTPLKTNQVGTARKMLVQRQCPSYCNFETKPSSITIMMAIDNSHRQYFYPVTTYIMVFCILPF